MTEDVNPISKPYNKKIDLENNLSITKFTLWDVEKTILYNLDESNNGIYTCYLINRVNKTFVRNFVTTSLQIVVLPPIGFVQRVSFYLLIFYITKSSYLY